MSRSILEDKIPAVTLQYDTVEDDMPHIYDFIEDDSTYTEMQPIPREKTYAEIQPEYYNCGELKNGPSFTGMQVIDCPAYGACGEGIAGDGASDNGSIGSQCA